MLYQHKKRGAHADLKQNADPSRIREGSANNLRSAGYQRI